MADKAQFEQAQKDVKTLSKKPDNDDLLFLYAHYKQGSAGEFSVVGSRDRCRNTLGLCKCYPPREKCACSEFACSCFSTISRINKQTY